MEKPKKKGTILLDTEDVQDLLIDARNKAVQGLQGDWATQSKHFANQNEVFSKLELPLEISERLFAHQRIGIDWMYHLHKNQSGGILGDDMGMGKVKVLK